MKIFRVLSALLMLVPSAGSAQTIVLKAALAAKNAKALSASTSNDTSSASGASSGSGISPLSPYPTPVSLPSYGGPSSAAWSTPAGGPMCGAPERQELDKITALNMIETQKTAQKLRSVNDEREDSAARYNALFEKQKLELSPLEFTLKRMQIESNIQEEKFKMELADMRQERERLHLRNDVEREKLAAEQIKSDSAKLKLDVALRDLDYESRKLRMDAEVADHKTVALRSDLDLRAKKEEWKKEANRDPEYPLQPFKDGILTISDRRVTLDGPIVTGTADAVTERIHYFNNKDETLPIFVVIDRCPGGSVMEGYRIVKAISASKAPVHVVVKSYAASMAAVITTLAPHSYIYPNAVILHHQILSFSFGNLTQQKEQLDILKEWYKRLAEPVAKKVGYSLDGWTKEMYKHSSDGDWQEFGDEAVRLKWADHVVHEIRETGFLKDPETEKNDEKGKMAYVGLTEQTDSQGKRFMRLPRLQPYDAYWIDNQDGYYR
ncbi:MAG: ATP-dependent Clp protease proteolytic subunit [Elusimicrobia bacterium]|nr:ATP-dependent Clp protease proteolytic subunit [Elusimicrobiota bacterium]